MGIKQKKDSGEIDGALLELIPPRPPGTLTDTEVRRFIARFRYRKVSPPDWLRAEHARLQREWTARRVPNHLVHRARSRAKAAGTPCHLTPEDVVIPDCCPVCSQPMQVGGRKSNSPSIDRVDNDLPYVRHNIVVICHDCNRRKGDSTPEQMYQIADFVYKMRKELRRENGDT